MTAPVNTRVEVDLAAGVILASLSIIALVWLIPYHVQASAGEYDISPGFFPRLAAWTVLVLSGVLIITRLLRTANAEARSTGATILFDVCVWAGVAITTVISLPRFGFLPTACVLISAGMLFAGCRNGWVIVLVAPLFPLFIDQATWMIFSVDLP